MSNQSNSDIQGESTFSLIIKVAVVTVCRLVLNTARRFAYPFAPVLSRSLGVPLTAITSLIAVNQATGILGMFFGPVADRFGYRLVMLAGLMNTVWAQETRTEIPAFLTTPDKVESKIGTLQFNDGYPTRETAAKIRDELDYLFQSGRRDRRANLGR